MRLTLVTCKLNPFISLSVELKCEGRERLDKFPHPLPRLKRKGNKRAVSQREVIVHVYTNLATVFSPFLSPFNGLQGHLCTSFTQQHAAHIPFTTGKKWMALGSLGLPTGHFVEGGGREMAGEEEAGNSTPTYMYS